MPGPGPVLPANNWRCRGYQVPLWRYLRGGGKRAIAVWHRRAGKDDVALHHAACSMFERVGTYWHLLPEAAQARKAVWDAVNPNTGMKRIDEAFPRNLWPRRLDQNMFLESIKGSTWQVVGSDNYNSLVGSPPVGVVFSEWALANPSAWAYIRPILRENGGWAVFIYTPRGRNHGATFYEGAKDDDEWFTQVLSADDTPVFSNADLAQELKEFTRELGKEDGEAKYLQEYMCDFNVAVVGSYYGRLLSEAEKDGRICAVPHDPALKVDTWWDLGHSDATSIWFAQKRFGEFALIDYHEATGGLLEDFAKLLVEKRENEGYVFGRHLWPHDGGHKTLASKGRPLNELFYDLGFTVEVQPRHDVQVGITRSRQVLQNCWFDRERCELGLDSLRQYRKQWDDKNKTYRPRPLHDWASHGADAFRTGAMAVHGPGPGNVRPRRSRDYEGSAQITQPSSWAA
jgi:hypothetical protein|tara:strand:- start:4911 stop:6281 length:1371 start_codon:yes stop_codon:yes gene_type:complete